MQVVKSAKSGKGVCSASGAGGVVQNDTEGEEFGGF